MKFNGQMWTSVPTNFLNSPPSSVLLTFLTCGAKILKETWGENTLIPLYDNEDSVCGIIYNNKSYYFLKNLQGDIIEVLDGDTGSTVVYYRYNAWGVCMSIQDTSDCNIGNINPFRYRGYYYDNGLQMYYLQSRYYDPFVGRFINGDAVEFAVTEQSPLVHNLFAYCGNDVIIYIDSTGYGRIYSIYYDNSNTGFYNQAKNSPYYNSKKINLRSVISISDFKDVWSSMNGTIDYIYLYLHGGKGKLYFKNETMYIDQIKKLDSKKVKYRVYLFSCHGGDGKEGNNVAWAFAKLTNTKVYACTGGISYSKIFGKYYARKAWDWGYIKTFYYGKKYIFWGSIVAKSFPGQW